MTISKDYHGCTVAEALNDVERVIGEVRLSKKTQQAEFITGFGIIRLEVLTLLEEYSLSPHYKIGNDGTILVTIE